MSISEHKHVSKDGVVPARRIEVFTGAGRRRSWTADEKAAIVAESFGEGVRACHVARRHGLTPQQLFTWRRAARRQFAAGDVVMQSMFAPAIVAEPAAEIQEQKERTDGAHPPIIELEIGGASVWIWRGADTTLVTAIVGALKAGK
jgi:transposase